MRHSLFLVFVTSVGDRLEAEAAFPKEEAGAVVEEEEGIEGEPVWLALVPSGRGTDDMDTVDGVA